MGSIITRINDRIDEFGSLEAYLAYLEVDRQLAQVAPIKSDVHDIRVVNIRSGEPNKEKIFTRCLKRNVE